MLLLHKRVEINLVLKLDIYIWGLSHVTYSTNGAAVFTSFIEGVEEGER